MLLQFDKSINQTLSTRVKSRLTFKAGKLNTYRFCDNVWTFMLNDVEFREVQEVTRIDKVKIVACDGKSKKLPAVDAVSRLTVFLWFQVLAMTVLPRSDFVCITGICNAAESSDVSFFFKYLVKYR